MTELTEEQLELQEKELIAKKLKTDLDLGRSLEKLRKNRDFKKLINGVFIADGKEILWQNIRYLTEGQMKGQGNDKNLELIEKIKAQVEARLNFEAFMDTVENDYENAKAELEEQERE